MMKLLLVVFMAVMAEATWRRNIEHVVPEKVYNYLDKWGWGSYHVVFHAARKWYVLGERGRNWLRSLGETQGAQLQEGDPENGIEFLTMHRAMIEHLSERWGSEKVHNDPDGKRTMADVFVDWKTDAEVIRALKKWEGDWRRFERGLRITNDFDAFASEDDFGNYLQTSMKLSGQVDPNDSARRFYDRDTRAGAGVHNWLHGQFMKQGSPISVGDPETNLKNIMFWRIHGWIENKWKQFEQHHTRTRHEKELYDKHMRRFRLQMQLHSDFHLNNEVQPRNPVPPRTIPAPPRRVNRDMQEVIFQNRVECNRLTDGTRTDECPNGNGRATTTSAPTAGPRRPWWQRWLGRG